MNRDQLISLCFIALLIFIIREIFFIFSPFMQALFWSAILAFGFFPLYTRTRQILKGNNFAAAFLVTILIFFCVILSLGLLIANITAQAIDLYQSVSHFIREGYLESTIDRIRSIAFVQNLEERLFTWDPLKENIASWFLNSSKAITNFAVSQAGIITKNLFFIILNILLVTFFTFIFFVDGGKVYQFIYQIAPLEPDTKKAVFEQINETFSAVIRGQILTSLAQASVAGVIYWLCGVPAPIIFAAITFIATLIPVIGAASVWVPLVIYLFTLKQILPAVALFLCGAFIISLIDNIVKPALIGKRTKLPYFLLFLGILGGIKLYGLTGIFLAPAVLSLFFALIKIYQEKYL